MTRKNEDSDPKSSGPLQPKQNTSLSSAPNELVGKEYGKRKVQLKLLPPLHSARIRGRSSDFSPNQNMKKKNEKGNFVCKWGIRCKMHRPRRKT
jgi:hypothetical protein